MHILLIEDDTLLADGLIRALRRSGHPVDAAVDGSQADAQLAAKTYELVVLDLGLPGLDGSQVLQRLRLRGQETPVLVMSARLAIEERVRLLDLGADDYLVKPVAVDELEARIRAITRRIPESESKQLRIGSLRLDLDGKRAWIGKEAMDLTAREWSAIEFLATRANRIVSKEQFISALYDDEDDITPNAVEKFISRLRTKLECAGITIRTVRGLGYYLEKPAENG